MRKITLLYILLMFAVCGFAQKQRPFNPEKFQAELEQYVATEAALTIQESSAFFPLYREMRKKQHAIFGQMRRYRFTDTFDDKASMEAIKQQDMLDIQIKLLQQEYHNKFMEILPAGKVFKIIKAEDKFHRQSFKRMVKKNEK